MDVGYLLLALSVLFAVASRSPYSYAIALYLVSCEWMERWLVHLDIFGLSDYAFYTILLDLLFLNWIADRTYVITGKLHLALLPLCLIASTLVSLSCILFNILTSDTYVAVMGSIAALMVFIGAYDAFEHRLRICDCRRYYDRLRRLLGMEGASK